MSVMIYFISRWFRTALRWWNRRIGPSHFTSISYIICSGHFVTKSSFSNLFSFTDSIILSLHLIDLCFTTCPKCMLGNLKCSFMASAWRLTILYYITSWLNRAHLDSDLFDLTVRKVASPQVGNRCWCQMLKTKCIGDHFVTMLTMITWSISECITWSFFI